IRQPKIRRIRLPLLTNHASGGPQLIGVGQCEVHFCCWLVTRRGLACPQLGGVRQREITLVYVLDVLALLTRLMARPDGLHAAKIVACREGFWLGLRDSLDGDCVLWRDFRAGQRARRRFDRRSGVLAGRRRSTTAELHPQIVTAACGDYCELL